MTDQASRPAHVSPSWRMTQFIWGAMPVQAISIAAKLGISDLVAQGPRSVDDLAKTTKTHTAALQRLLRALASLGIFAEDADGRFLNTPLSETLRSDHAESVRALGIMWGTPFFWRPWGDLCGAVTTGQPSFDSVFQESFFDYLAHHAGDASIFNAAMTAVSSMELSAVLAAYDFSRFGRIADIGGGHGALLHGILVANPGVRGILYDHPAVVAGATALRTGAMAARCEVLDGDFFEAVPAGADAYILKRIIHDWNDEDALKILKHCRRAIGRDGTLLLIECVLKPPNEPDLGKFLDLHMLVLLGGRERTESDFKSLLRKAGFSLTRVIPTGVLHSIIEGTPLEL